MWAFALRRFLHTIPILFGVSLIVFLLVRLMPGDAADILIPPEAPPEVRAMLRAAFGLDQPVHIQYGLWLHRLLLGDLGVSIFSNQPVTSELFSALGNTLKLALPAAVLGFSLGVTLGVLAAFNRGRWLYRLFSAIAITGVSLPHY